MHRRFLAACIIGASRLVRQVGTEGDLNALKSCAGPVMGGNLITRHSHNEPPPGSRCAEDLVRKARETPERMSDSEWREVLSSVQYQVARGHGTERAWSGKYNDNSERGMYHCVCCNAALFPSKYKFDSGSGWPSFYDTERAEDRSDNITRKTDRSLMMTRTEVLCSRCQAHLGHVFNDGPPPTGLRYCINSAALHFQKEE